MITQNFDPLNIITFEIFRPLKILILKNGHDQNYFINILITFLKKHSMNEGLEEVDYVSADGNLV